MESLGYIVVANCVRPYSFLCGGLRKDMHFETRVRSMSSKVVGWRLPVDLLPTGEAFQAAPDCIYNSVSKQNAWNYFTQTHAEVGVLN